MLWPEKARPIKRANLIGVNSIQDRSIYRVLDCYIFLITLGLLFEIMNISHRDSCGFKSLWVEEECVGIAFYAKYLLACEKLLAGSANLRLQL